MSREPLRVLPSFGVDVPDVSGALGKSPRVSRCSFPLSDLIYFIDTLLVRMSHGALVLKISVIYLVLIATLRLTVDATSETHRHVCKMVDFANTMYEKMNSSTSTEQRLMFASMSLAAYRIIIDTEHVSHVFVDRIAQCDVKRRRKRLQRLINAMVVPNGTTTGESVLSMVA